MLNRYTLIKNAWVSLNIGIIGYSIRSWIIPIKIAKKNPICGVLFSDTAIFNSIQHFHRKMNINGINEYKSMESMDITLR